MPRYFYTDPLKSAWMAREFGVRIMGYANGEEWPFQSIDELDYSSSVMQAILIAQKSKYRFIIHPDSLPIFEPKVGDVLEFEYPEEGDKQVCIVCVDKCRDIPVFEQGIELPLEEETRIIQRDNKAFFMPEVEDLSVAVWGT